MPQPAREGNIVYRWRLYWLQVKVILPIDEGHIACRCRSSTGEGHIVYRWRSYCLQVRVTFSTGEGQIACWWMVTLSAGRQSHYQAEGHIAYGRRVTLSSLSWISRALYSVWRPSTTIISNGFPWQLLYNLTQKDFINDYPNAKLGWTWIIQKCGFLPSNNKLYLGSASYCRSILSSTTGFSINGHSMNPDWKL